ncbi:MAG: N-acetylmuramoyl-L-alanine amidase [Clostridia bacterium]|nr:N-acetylmuramoyl-L-alanine amidase [Clostridia bacterium]
MKNNKGFFVMRLNINKKKTRLFALLAAVIFVSLIVFKPNAPHHARAASVDLGEREGARAVIVVDAGHGGVDGGAVSLNGTPEKDINLSIALKLRSLLLLNGFDVIMTRESDVSIHDADVENGTIREKKVSDISNRIKILKNSPDAILISIHQNTFSSADASGSQVFYVKNEQSRRLAEIMQTHLVCELCEKGNRAPKEAYDTIKLMNSIENTGVLVECGFLSNPDDEAKLLSEDYQRRIARCILNALDEFLIETESEG